MPCFVRIKSYADYCLGVHGQAVDDTVAVDDAAGEDAVAGDVGVDGPELDYGSLVGDRLAIQDRQGFARRHDELAALGQLRVLGDGDGVTMNVPR